MFFYGWVGDCYLNLGEEDKSIIAYEKALDIAERLGDVRDQVARYQSKLEGLRGRG